jgi:hypothetical protein
MSARRRAGRNYAAAEQSFGQYRLSVDVDGEPVRVIISEDALSELGCLRRGDRARFITADAGVI